jgi:hypothetical protein
VQTRIVGVTSHARTLRARVVELEIDEEHLHHIAADYVLWFHREPDPEETDGYIQDLQVVADSDWPAGTVLERWGWELRDITENPAADERL